MYACFSKKEILHPWQDFLSRSHLHVGTRLWREQLQQDRRGSHWKWTENAVFLLQHRIGCEPELNLNWVISTNWLCWNKLWWCYAKLISPAASSWWYASQTSVIFLSIFNVMHLCSLSMKTIFVAGYKHLQFHKIFRAPRISEGLIYHTGRILFRTTSQLQSSTSAVR